MVNESFYFDEVCGFVILSKMFNLFTIKLGMCQSH